MRLPIVFVVIATLACGQQQAGVTTSTTRPAEEWVSDLGLTRPESVIFDRANDCYYASNSPEYKFTGKGYLSKHAMDGSLIDSSWVVGLNRPTGMAQKGNRLFVGDIDRLVEIDVSTAKIIGSYKTNSKEIPGINDVAVDTRGGVYVTASAMHAVYRLAGDVLQLWAQDTTLLRWANGIVVQDDQLIVAGYSLARIPLESQIPQAISIAEGIHDFDGLKALAAGGFLLSSAGGDNKIWFVNESGETAVIYESESYSADFELLEDRQLLVIPSGNTSENRYLLKAIRFTKQ